MGAVYTVDRYQSTPAAILEALFREPGDSSEPSSSRPEPKQKRIRGSLIRDEAGTYSPSNEEIFGWLEGEARLRNPDRDKPLILLMDGQESLWKAGVDALPENQTTKILDLVHANAYLWNAARLFHVRGSVEAEQFVKQRNILMLNGKIHSVIHGLRRIGSLHKLRVRKHEELDTICGYFENNTSRMNYHEYLAASYPIASGIIEVTCPNLAKDRMGRSRMRWILDCEHAMLRFRSVFLCGL